MKKIALAVIVGLAMLVPTAPPAQAGTFDPTIHVTTPKPDNTVRVRYRIACDGEVAWGHYRAQTPTTRHLPLPTSSPRSCRLKAWAWNLTGPSSPEVDVSL